MSKRKYKPIYMIESITDFDECNCKWYEMNVGGKKRMWHRSALESLQYHTLHNFIKHGYVFACEKVDEVKTDGETRVE